MKSDPLPTEGQVIPAFVTAVSEKGCFVRISRTTAGRVLLKDLDDGFVENPKEAFPVGKLVEGKVMSVDHIKGMVQLSLKPSVVIGDTKAKKEIERIKEDDVVKGTVERVNEIGVFVRINGTSLVGLARKATALQDSSKALQEEYQVGDVVRAKVLRVSASTLKIALGLRESYFRNETLDEEEESGSDEEEEVEDSDDEDVIQLGGDDDEDDEEEDSEDDEEQEEDGEEVEEDDDDEEDGDEEDDDDDVADYDEDDIGKEVEEQVVKEVKSVSKVRLTLFYLLFTFVI